MDEAYRQASASGSPDPFSIMEQPDKRDNFVCGEPTVDRLRRSRAPAPEPCPPPSYPAQMTLAAWLALNHDIDRIDRELLAAHVLETTRARVIARPDRPLMPPQRQSLNGLAARWRRGEPMAYLFGAKEFFGLAFKVNPSVLVPRPETELLVEFALAKAKPGDRVLDLGTGSGCIAITLKAQRPDLQVTATDLSATALQVAAENAARHHADIAFLRGDWLKAVRGQFDLILANPPYVADLEPALTALRHEPQEALNGGDGGLDAIKAIIYEAADQLSPRAWLCLEHGHDQAPAVAAQLRMRGYQGIATEQDLAGQPRLTSCRRPNP